MGKLKQRIKKSFLYKSYKYLYKKKVCFFNTIAPVYQTKKTYKHAMKKKLNLKNPQTINEKIQYLKLNNYYKNDLVSLCADKYGIRGYLNKKGMDEILPELYGVYDSANDIEWGKLPTKYVLKCNHGCGYNILCANSKSLDKNKTIQKLNGWLREDYWKYFGEFHYSLIKKKIIVEEYLGDDIATYKFYCFNGIPKLLYISYNGEDGEKDKYVTYYDLNLNILPYRLFPHDRKEGKISKPDNYGKMVECAEKLSAEFPFVRVDLYDVNGRIYISELTFLPTGGYMHLEPEGTDLEWGNWLKL